jgi:uncharacterized protein
MENYMKCPVDNSELVMSERSGVEIDYCPTCRGVWLDRGELDRIIERSEGSAPIHPPRLQQTEPRHAEKRYDQHHGNYDHHKKHKKESWLGEMFDF